MSGATVAAIVAFLAAGFVLGGALTTVVARLPSGESLAAPGPRCRECGHALSARELVPLVSFFAQRGRCRHCGARIPRRYPVIEAGTALGFLLSAWLLYGTGDLWTTLALCLLAVAATAIDLEHRIIPNRLLVAAAVLVLATLAPKGLPALVAGVEGALLLFAVALIIAVIGRGGFGMGDVKYLAVVGLALGPARGLLALFLAILTGGLYAFGLVVTRRAGRKDTIAFGPFIALGSVVTPLLAVLLPTHPGGPG